MNEPYVLVLYASKYGTTRELALTVAEGVEQAGVAVRVRTVPEVQVVTQVAAPPIPPEGELYCSAEDLRDCAGLALGSPTRFGNMAASLKFFLDQTTASWLAGDLQGKPACVFASTGTQHGGQESTLLSMMIPLLHHGMLLMGLPYALPQLSTTPRGGTPYGATRVTGVAHDQPLHPDERALALAQGRRLAGLVQRLALTGGRF